MCSSPRPRALVGSPLPEGVSIFPLGERRLKDIDEPERVFELEIDGAARPEASVPEAAVPDAPAGDEEAWESDFGKRMAARINARVKRSVEASLERVMSDVDALADRATKRPDEIAEQIERER
jgi:hypothetical protein